MGLFSGLSNFASSIGGVSGNLGSGLRSLTASLYGVRMPITGKPIINNMRLAGQLSRASSFLTTAQYRAMQVSEIAGTIDAIVKNPEGAITGIVNQTFGPVIEQVRNLEVQLEGVVSSFSNIGNLNNAGISVGSNTGSGSSGIGPRMLHTLETGPGFSGGGTGSDGIGRNALGTGFNSAPSPNYGPNSSYTWSRRTYGDAFEEYAAKLVPFWWPDGVEDPGHPLYPIWSTKGILFPYMPRISEGRTINYAQTQLAHSNETQLSYTNTNSVQIQLSECVWTCDNRLNAEYALAVLHMLRSYSLMDFGKGKSGRPPSPFWFSSYGKYAFSNVPVLMTNASWDFPNDIEYIEVESSGDVTWMPVEFKVSSITLQVQHSQKFWANTFSLDDYYAGRMIL